MYRRPSPLIAFICVLFLLGAQQAAFAHWIGHIGVASAASAPVSGGDSDDGNTPSHACTTCVAFAAFNAAPPAFLAPIVVAHTAAISLPDIPPTYVPAHSALPYTARAPPAVL